MMKYFQDITDKEQARQHYRTLAKQLHPDRGGSEIEFQELKQEYELLLRKIEQGQTSSPSNPTNDTSDLLDSIKLFTKVLIEKEVPQTFLKRKIESCKSKPQRDMYTELLELFDSIKIKKP